MSNIKFPISNVQKKEQGLFGTQLISKSLSLYVSESLCLLIPLSPFLRVPLSATKEMNPYFSRQCPAPCALRSSLKQKSKINIEPAVAIAFVARQTIIHSNNKVLVHGYAKAKSIGSM